MNLSVGHSCDTMPTESRSTNSLAVWLDVEINKYIRLLGNLGGTGIQIQNHTSSTAIQVVVLENQVKTFRNKFQRNRFLGKGFWERFWDVWQHLKNPNGQSFSYYLSYRLNYHILVIYIYIHN